MVEIIVDIGSNWRLNNVPPSEKRIYQLIEAAAAAGTDIIKFQHLRANNLYRTNADRDRLRPYEIPDLWLPKLKKAVNDCGCEFMSTPFYLEAVDMLDPYVDKWKIASWDITYLPLLKKIAENGKPVILSTGAATWDEVSRAYDILKDSELTLLHCVSGYPTPPEEAKLGRLNELRNWRDYHENIVSIGFSSHVTNPVITASSVLLGAEVIEVHFDFGDGLGIEAGHSYTPKTLPQLISWVELFEQALKNEENDDDYFARINYRRDPSDWLRPVLESGEL